MSSQLTGRAGRSAVISSDEPGISQTPVEQVTTAEEAGIAVRLPDRSSPHNELNRSIIALSDFMEDEIHGQRDIASSETMTGLKDFKNQFLLKSNWEDGNGA